MTVVKKLGTSFDLLILLFYDLSNLVFGLLGL